MMGPRRAARLLRRILCPATLLVAGTAAAQETAPLAAGCVNIAPLCTVAENGEFNGFMVDLARGIEAHTGIRIAFEPILIENVIRLQNEGRIQILPGTPRLDTLVEENVISIPVAESETRLFVTLENQHLVASGAPEGLDIVYVQRGAGANFPDLARTNRIEPRDSLNDIIMELLSGQADASINAELGLSRLLRKLRLDNRIVAAGPPIASEPRLVYLHRSRADLLGPINDAIATMQENGELAAIRSLWGIDAPDPVPEVLTVGSVGFPPNTINNPDGTYSGFAVESLRKLAELAGLEIEFRTIDRAEFRAGPSSNTYDMLPLFGITPQRQERMDFTIPFDGFPHSIFTRKGDAQGVTGLDSLKGRRVGVGVFNQSRYIAEARGDMEIQTYRGPAAVLDALLTGEVDAILFVTSAMREAIAAAGATDALEEVRPPFVVIEGATALRFGLGPVRERLNAVIPGFLISDEYQELRRKYFGPPVFWTEARIYSLAAVIALLFTAMATLMLVQRHQRNRQQAALNRQQRELENEQQHSEELARLVTELERSNRELDDFAYTASHDLKEPLRGIAINASFMARDPEPEEAHRRIERILVLTRQMEKLISDLLYFSRLGRGEAKAVLVEPTRINEALKAELQEWIAERNGEVVIATDLPPLHADPSKIKTVFQNLIVNGLKYNDSDRKTVEIGHMGETVVNGSLMRDVFFVRDNGIGIDEKQRDKVFRIFKRLNPDRAYGHGTGAGLAFVQKIIDGYEGVVTFTSNPEGGTVFYFTLPLARQDALSEPAA